MFARCEFNYHFGLGYTCFVKSQEKTFQGVHKKYFKNTNVRRVVFEDSKLERIPDKIGEVFANVTSLLIWNSNLKEISKENLRQFPNLKQIDMRNNELEYLPGDLFEFNSKLEEIWLHNNKIKYIGPQLLDKLPNLTVVDLENNQNINKKFNKFGNSLTLSEIKEEIRWNCKPPSDFLKEAEAKAFGLSNISRQSFENRHKDLDNFLALDDFKDFAIKVGSKVFKVHKLILMARSPFFRETIRNNSSRPRMVLTDIPVEVFESILDFIYTDKLPKSPKNAREIFAAAGKMKIKGLMEIAGEILMKEIEEEENLDFLFEILNLGAKFECEELKLKAFEEIKKQFLDGELKNELLEDPEKLKILIEAKKMINEFMMKKNVENCVEHESQRKRFRHYDSCSR